MTATTDDGGGGMSRRTFLRGVGATAAAGAGLAYGCSTCSIRTKPRMA